MTNVHQLHGKFDDAMLAALFVDNSQPTGEDIEAALRDANVYAEAASRLIEREGVNPRRYAHQQSVFGPIVRLLALAGWTLSGAGYFSIAFHKGGLALKLGIKPEDDGCLPYYEWCKDKGHLPGVPLLHAVGRWDNCYVAVMDRYEPLAGELDSDTGLYEPSVEAEFEALRTATRTGVSCGSFPVCATASAIHHAFRDEHDFDVNENNVMLDRNMRLIITDPLGLPSGAYYPCTGAVTSL